MGFIFFNRSPRFVGNSFQVPAEFPATIQKVGVFVDETVGNVQQAVQQHKLQYVQLHGRETPDVCRQLRSGGVGVIKVFPVDDDFNFALTRSYTDSVDYFLFDTKGKLPGGNGTTFDWKVLEKYPSKKPFFLSGGIGLDEMDAVNEILKTNLPVYAIDVNSKFEIEPGLKNTEALQQCITIKNS